MGTHVSAGTGFLHEMLAAAGGRNVFGEIGRESAQPSLETIIARAPDVIIELRYGDGLRASEIPRYMQAWNTLASVPAVKNRRVHVLVGDEFVTPGPRVVDAVRHLARTLHPDIR